MLYLQEASIAEIKKAYRKLTLTHHPDKGGDEKRFLRISKAYQAYVLELRAHKLYFVWEISYEKAISMEANSIAENILSGSILMLFSPWTPVQ